MFPYKNLEVYNKAFTQNQKIYNLLKDKSGIPLYLKNQLGRASLSVMLNIAEGSGRFSKKDRRNFYIIARSSAFESAALVDFLFIENEIKPEENLVLISGFEEISKVLFVMIRNLEK